MFPLHYLSMAPNLNTIRENNFQDLFNTLRIFCVAYLPIKGQLTFMQTQMTPGAFSDMTHIFT